jgi:hypothetical protein
MKMEYSLIKIFKLFVKLDFYTLKFKLYLDLIRQKVVIRFF